MDGRAFASRVCRWAAVASLGLLFALPHRSAPALANQRLTAPPVAVQAALDARNFSPGPIDGTLNERTVGALKAFQQAQGLSVSGTATKETLQQLQAGTLEETLTTYVITDKDTRGPFQPEIPKRLEDKASLEHLSYQSVKELLAERFHMDEKYLSRLNPKAQFVAGEEIRVVRIKRDPLPAVTNIEVDKGSKSVRAYAGSKLVAHFPASIGSDDKPSPTGDRAITGIARNPSYTYDPSKLDFKGVQASEKFTVKPGPNNPVGLVWIALNEDGYGIHGAPQPSTIAREKSHGCVRLTNWDVLHLADKVRKGVPVSFIEGAPARRQRSR